MNLSADDIQALILTAKLASLVTVILIIIATPLAWWLSQTSSRFKAPITALIAMPLVLPPSVLGFYLLLAMGANGPVGFLTQQLGMGLLPFTFSGLVVASLFYSLPFVVQPIYNAMKSIDSRYYDAAATLRAGAFNRFFYIVLPLSKSGFMSAGILGFAHTVGEFGVILMIGGNIPQETRVASIQIYDHVESLNYANAHALSLSLLAFSFIVLMLSFSLTKPDKSS